MLTYCNSCQCNHSQGTAACGSTGLTMADLTALEQAIASGALKVKYRDQEITYGSFDDLRARHAFVKAAVCGVPEAARSRRVQAVFSSGLGCSGTGSGRYGSI